jgi:hypothetical protein
MTPQPSVFLYWVTNPAHDDDWFVLARDPEQARSCLLGYEVLAGTPGAEVEHIPVVPFPSPGPGALPRRAGLDDLSRLGFECCCAAGPQKIVRYQGRIFIQGDLDLLILTSRDDILEADGKGRPNGTASRHIPGSSC